MRRSWMPLLGGIGIGAALMYALDPDKGHRRRAVARDKVKSAGNKTRIYLGKFSRDARNRAQGYIAETTERIRDWAGKPRGGPVSDERLVERVRSNLGHYAVHQRALDVSASEGRVTLRGEALASEVEEIVRAVSSVSGVREVNNEMNVHEDAGSVPSLQGEMRATPASGRW